MTGALVNAVAIDLATLTGGVAATPIEVLEAPNGELWVSDQTADTIFRISADGTTLLGSAPSGLDNCRGFAISGGNALVSNAGTNNTAPGQAIVEIDGAGAVVGSTLIGNPFDVEPFTFNGVAGFLVCDITGEDLVFAEAANLANQTIFHDSDGVTGIDFPEQVHVSASGRIFAGGFTAPSGIYEYDTAGNQVNFIDTVAIASLGGIRGVVELGNGNLLFTNGSGVHIYDVTTMTVTTEISGVSARFGSIVGGGSTTIGSNYCTAVPNSSGTIGTMSAVGSAFAAANNVTITASGLPNGQFGIFVTSLDQGFVPGAGGTSNGNICLGGVIGRYTSPSQILSTGTTGSFSLPIDLTMVPQGNGTASVMAGEDWNFQAWHRDGVGLGSNFTDGLEISFQ